MYPVKKVRITSPYGNRVYDGWHYGLDFGAEVKGEIGDHILAIADGIVRVSKYNAGGYGHYIVVEHDGYCSLYAHLYHRKVKIGDKVKEGDVIGLMGNTPLERDLGVHLHLEVRNVPYNSSFWDKTSINGKRTPIHCVDPSPYLERIDYKKLYEETLEDLEIANKKLLEIERILK